MGGAWGGGARVRGLGEGGGEAAAAAAAAPSACSRCIFRVGGVMVTGEGAAEVRGVRGVSGTGRGLVGGQSLMRAGAAGVGWSWSSSVEAAACVSTLVFVLIPVSPVCRCHVHTGAQVLLHTCASSQVQTCQAVLSYPASAAFLARELLGWPLAWRAVRGHPGPCHL